MTREEEIRARLENIVPGGWARATPMVEGYPTEIWHAIDNTTICRLAKTEDEYANSDFIRMAPEDIDYLLKENQRLRGALENVKYPINTITSADAIEYHSNVCKTVDEALDGAE